jgi:hypothetical protein
MAKDLFRMKFEENILSYPESYESGFARGMKIIGKIIGDSISGREYEKFFQKAEKKFLEALEICKEYDLDCDAVESLERYVFNGNNSSVNTMDCPRWEDFKGAVNDYLCDLPDRGFVYITWRVSPLDIYYIGMTEKSGSDRLNLVTHGKLSRAIEKGATKFTIVFPDASQNIKFVESSLIRIMKRLGYGDELLNTSKGKFKEYHGEIDDLKKLINKVKASLGKTL